MSNTNQIHSTAAAPTGAGTRAGRPLTRGRFLAILASALTAGGAGCFGEGAAVDALEKIKRRGKLIVGVFGDKPPFGYIDSQGRNAGFDVTLARRLAGDLLGGGDKAEFVTLEASNRVAFLLSNKVDVILANFTRTPERALQVDFARPYMKVALGLIAPERGAVTSLEKLKSGGGTLVVNKGTTAELWFTERHPEVKLLKFDQNTEAFQALKDGRGDALAHDNTLLFAWANQNAGFKVVESALGNADVIAPAVKKGAGPLLRWLDEAIDRLSAERFFHKAFDSDLRPFFGAGVAPESVIIEQ